MTSRIARIATAMPMGLRAVNAYLVPLPDGGYLLVDGGVDTEEAWLQLDAGVREHASWSDVRVHFASHMHLDHIGLNTRVREACGATLVMGELDAERMAHAAAKPAEERSYRRQLLGTSGVPDQVVERAMAPPLGKPNRAFVAADVRLPAGESALPQPAGEWRAIWTPGHTAGHTVLFRERDRLLIAGDAVLLAVEPTIGVNRQRPDPVADHLQSLTRLYELSPSEILPGHGDPLQGVDRIRASREALLRSLERALELVQSRETAWGINVRLHSHRGLRMGALLHELRGTLALLEHHLRGGRVQAEWEDGVRFFYPALSRD